MSALPCTALRADLPEFVGGDLTVARTEEVRRHLLDCSACRCEAASLQQARKALRSAAGAGTSAGSGPAAVDEALFGAMHAEVMTAIGREIELAGAPHRGRLLLRILFAAAAVLLFGFGYWLVAGRDDEAMFRRDPVSVTREPLRAVPWSGPRARLQQLGFDETEVDPEMGAGMMRRLQLRRVGDESFRRR